jgi:polyisoprenyl-phosphate glycosyltransferase
MTVTPLSSTPAEPKIDLSVAVPCYNEAAVLQELHRRVTAVCSGITPHYEIVLANDGSSDDSWPIIVSLTASDNHVVGVNLSRNHGHQLALSAGLAYCRGARILILDADLQDPPELLPEMMSRLDAGADVAYGQRTSRAGEPLFKRLSAYLFYRLIGGLTDCPIPADTGDFRLITRRVLSVFNAMPENHRFIRGMIAWVGFQQVAVPYAREPRFAGTTKYPLPRMLIFALDAITSFSVRPLRLAFFAGFALCGLALALLGYSVYAYFAGETIRGWTSVMGVVLISLAAQFLFLGLIGEYVGRLYLEAKKRPLFVVQEVARGGAAEDTHSFGVTT